MTETKYLYSGGLAFSEQKDMDRLRELAKEGWLLDRMQFVGYRLKKGEPQDVEYSLDYQKKPDEEYFSYFEAAGWTHVCSVGNEIQIFRAPAGTMPIHTDSMTKAETYRVQKNVMGKIALPALCVTLLLFFLAKLGDQGTISGGIGIASLLLGFLAMLVLIFTGMPFVGYSYKLRKLRKG